MTIARISVKDENELRKIVVSNVSAVEKELTAICHSMPIDSKTNIDVLCHDENGQLVILKLSTKENDNMFFEGLKILAYMNNVKPMIKFSYKDFKINDAKTPRLIFLAPSFSVQLVDVVGQMQGIQMDLYTWEYFEFDDKKALHLEPVWLSEATKSIRRRTKPEKLKPLETAEKKPEKQPETVTEEFVMPPEEVKPEQPKKEQKERAKKKSIFSI
ncbi:MAG: hypothetical protein OEY24_05265 [Candidatus Bathyarchaeota archaeon]|nr:hypothetical protein [Candidatus Bathyarchaeota archaeon]MDH5495092.1 hypothetical protein [Candidatus Bathyarchaeota archaeon]